MLEFQRSRETMRRYLEKSQHEFRDAKGSFEAAEHQFDKVVKAREEMLQNILNEKGLALCAGDHYTSITEEYGNPIKNPTAEDLGIFPRDQMRLRFVQGLVSHEDHFTSFESEYTIHEVKLLCPEHYKEESIFIYGSEETPKIIAEVDKEGDKFILKADGTDITKLIKRGPSHDSQIMIDGNPRPDVFVYRFLGIPDLPEEPDLDKVRHSY